MSYLRDELKPTPQSEPLDERQVKNLAGGYSYEASPLERLRRFLILGTEGGSYYAGQREMTREQIANLRKLVKENGSDVVKLIVDVSEGGLAPKNDPALLALAIASVDGDQFTRSSAFHVLPRVARIGTHLFQWLGFRDALGGWGRGARRAVSNWYEDKSPDDLAYQMVKYRQRDGWTHRDALRLSHATSVGSDVHGALYDFACGRVDKVMQAVSLPPIVSGYQRAQEVASPRESAQLIAEFRLPREAIQTDHLTSPEVWEALLDGMPMTAMIRNLANMTRVGVIAPMNDGTKKVVEALSDGDRLRKARVHPIQVLSAMVTYASGHGARGSGEWEPVREIVDALDAAFYLAFGAVKPANKRTLMALDVSSSMSMGQIAGVPGLTPRVGSAAMALVTAATEPEFATVAFARTLVPLSLSSRERLDDVLAKVDALPFGGTDCALPMLHAIETGMSVETFVIYTDSETWAGEVHPMEALRMYRNQTGINAKLIIVGMVANDFTIADPQDGGALDVVGFDASAPTLMNAFSRGDL